MKSQLSHILFNIDQQNMPFYKDLMVFLGWEQLYEDATMLGVRANNGESVWFVLKTKDVANDYDGPGMNHLGIAAETQTDVDALVSYLAERHVQALFETPRHRPDFVWQEGHTYYQVMFETPDRILIEFVYTGPKAA